MKSFRCPAEFVLFCRMGLSILLVASVTGCLGGHHAAQAKARKGAKASGHVTMSDRTVELIGGIGRPMIKTAQKKLLELDQQSNEPVWFIINSPGGSVADGLILVDTMAAVKSPIHCLVESQAYSMAAIILTFCDARYVLPHGTIMLHEASYGTAGEDPSIRSRVDFIGRALDQLNAQISSRLGLSVKAYKEKIRDGWWLLADEAAKAGVVDAVVQEMSYVERPIAVTESKVTVTRKETTHEVAEEAKGRKAIRKRSRD